MSGARYRPVSRLMNVWVLVEDVVQKREQALLNEFGEVLSNCGSEWHVVDILDGVFHQLWPQRWSLKGGIATVLCFCVADKQVKDVI